MLQDPSWVKEQGDVAAPTPTFAYARDNPIKHTDPKGLDIYLFDDGVHWGAGFDIECKNSCSTGQDDQSPVLRIDYWCDSMDYACLARGAPRMKIITGNLRRLGAGGKTIRCAADCATTQRAMQKAIDSCSGSYNLFIHSCRDIVLAAFQEAGCPGASPPRNPHMR